MAECLGTEITVYETERRFGSPCPFVHNCRAEKRERCRPYAPRCACARSAVYLLTAEEGRKDGGRQLFKLIVRRWRGRPRLPLPSLPGIEGLLICFTRLRNRLFLLLGKPGPHKTASRLASCMASASEQGFIHNQFILNLFSYLASARNLTRRPNRIECLVTSLASIEVGLRKAFNENLEVGQQLSYQNFKMKLYWKTRFIFFG